MKMFFSTAVREAAGEFVQMTYVSRRRICSDDSRENSGVFFDSSTGGCQRQRSKILINVIKETGMKVANALKRYPGNFLVALW